jgi:thioredoxin-dependent peroxiredoxin
LVKALILSVNTGLYVARHPVLDIDVLCRRKYAIHVITSNSNIIRKFPMKVITKFFIANFALFTLLTPPASAALKLGSKATNFTTQAALAGEAYTYNLNTALKKGPVVLYFYPKAFSSGCTVEAHEFSVAADEFGALGASVIGMSADTIDTLKKFSVEGCRNKFTVGIAAKSVIKSYDVSLPVVGGSNRTTYVIAPNGKVIFAYSKLGVKGHVQGALKAVKNWRATRLK